MLSAVRHFTWNQADGAGTTYDVNFGFTPKMLIAFFCGRSETTDTTARGSVISSIGFAAGSTDRRSISYFSVDGGTSALVGSRQETASILHGCTTTGGASSALDVDAEANWSANSVRFIVDAQLAAGVPDLRVTVFACDTLTNVKTFQLQEPASAPSDVSVTGLGFRPDGVLFASIGFATAPPSGSGEGAIMLGAYDGTRQCVVSTCSDDASGTMDTQSYSYSGECIALDIYTAGRSITARASGKSLDGDGLTVTFSERASTRYVFGIAFKGCPFYIDNLQTQTNTSNFSRTGYGFQPIGGLYLSAAISECTQDTPVNHSRLSIGAAASATERAAQAWVDANGTANAQCATAIDYDAVYSNQEVNSTAHEQGTLDVASFDSDGQTLHMNLADPAQNQVFALMFGASSSTSSYSITGSGGMAFSGTAPTVRGRTVAPSGGVAFGGSAAQSGQSSTQSYAITGAGALILAGTAPPRRGRAVAGAGGLAFSGTTTPKRGRALAGAGALTFAGTVTPKRGRVLATSGVVDFSGTGAPGGQSTGSQSYAIVGAGGTVFSGTAATARGRRLPPSSGGLVLSGSVIPLRGYRFAGSGGLAFGGTAPVLRGALRIGAGGVAFSGASLVLRGVGWIGSGGLVFAGAALTRGGGAELVTVVELGASSATIIEPVASRMPVVILEASASPDVSLRASYAPPIGLSGSVEEF